MRRGFAGKVALCATFGLVVLLRKWHLRWGATDAEVCSDLDGDELLPDADLVATRAIAISAPTADVWPWVAQLGQGRAGFYSYDFLENLVGCDIHSATVIRDEWQAVGAGDDFRLHPEVVLTVIDVVPGKSLVVRGGVPMGDVAPPYDFIWAFEVRDAPGGATRLIVRERYKYLKWWAPLLVEPVGVVSFVMTQKMLRGIRDRAGSSAIVRGMEHVADSSREQAFVFGEVADDYERVRPGYPAALVDAILGFADSGNPRILEIGAGTGKATMEFASRGLEVVALEPSTEMARIASANLVEYPQVLVEGATFEECPEGSAPFDLIVAAQAWHWVGGNKYKRAAELLGRGGALAAFWNRAVWPDRQASEREALEKVYRDLEPQLLDAPAAFPGFAPYGREQTVAAELERSKHFDAPLRMSFTQSSEYTISEYLALLGTQSIHRMLSDERRAALMDALGAALIPFGDSIIVEIETRLVMARRA